MMRMALQHLSLKRNKILRKLGFYLTFVVSPGFLLDRPVQAAPVYTKTVDSFNELRREIVEMFGSAEKRIWMVTDYLSDGDIVSSLYIAKYRKTQVQVLLGKEKANHYLSRLNFLKKQNIPVFLKPKDFPFSYPTQILIDQKLILIDSELDFKTRRGKFVITYANESLRNQYQETFAQALNLSLPAKARKLPLVGNPRPYGRRYRGQPSYSPPIQSKDGAYIYSRGRQPRPQEVPKRLPGKTIWQKKQERKTTDQKDGNIVEEQDKIDPQ